MNLEEIEGNWRMIKDEVDPVIIGDAELEEVGFLISEVKRIREENERLSKEWQRCHDLNMKYCGEIQRLRKGIAEVMDGTLPYLAEKRLKDLLEEK